MDEELAETEGQMSPDDFVRLCNTNPRGLFKFVDEVVGGLLDQVQSLKEMVKDKDEALLELIDERDKFRDAFTRQALDGRGLSPVPEYTRKSERIPDPPLLTDGKDPKFEDWSLRMNDKLTANADRYPTAALRLAYVKSRCSGQAAEHLVARSRIDAFNPYRDAVDVLEHLKTIYQDVNRTLNAKARFRRLFMKNGVRFQEFLSEFSYLAQESELAEPEWKEELYYKLTTDMQRLVIRESNDQALGFKDFTVACTQTANRLEQISTNEQRNKGRQPRANTPASDSPTPNPPKKNPSQDNGIREENKLTRENRDQLMREGRCFTCKQKGHMSSSCPLKRHTSLKEIEPQEDKEVADEAGKVQP
jgi:hypothetical protein